MNEVFSTVVPMALALGHAVVFLKVFKGIKLKFVLKYVCLLECSEEFSQYGIS